nr:SGNH/GDSL hydrolase family protein [Clostridia bacterium]
MANRYKKWLHLPERYELVAGDTFELFWRGVMLCSDPYIYNIAVKCAKGAAYKRKFVWTPTEEDIGEHKLTVTVSDDYGDILDTAEVTLKVYPKAQSPAKEINVLCMGASATAGGQWPGEAHRRLTEKCEPAEGYPQGLGLDNVKFIGNKHTAYGTGYVGYGGWKFESYNTPYNNTSLCRYIICNHDKTQEDRHSIYADETGEWKLEDIENGRIKLMRDRYQKSEPITSGTLHHVSGGLNHGDIVYTDVQPAANNPMWNSAEERTDYKGFVKRIGADGIDIVVTLLGWNTWSSTEVKIKEQTRLFIENIHAEYPDAQIVILGLNNSSSQDGLGTNYGAGWNYIKTLEFTFNLEKWYREVASEYKNVCVVNVSGQFDSEMNYPTAERQVNIRTQKTEASQSNGVHPTNDGYMQIGDAVFRHLNAMICDMNK